MDVAGPPYILTQIWSKVLAGTERFSLESDGKIAYDASQGFRVRMDLLKIGNGCIEHLHEVGPFLGASIASKSDLLRLRAMAVVDRGNLGETNDFTWLLAAVARYCQVLPKLDKDELEYIVGAGNYIGVLDRLVLVSVLGANNAPSAWQPLEL